MATVFTIPLNNIEMYIFGTESRANESDSLGMKLKKSMSKGKNCDMADIKP